MPPLTRVSVLLVSWNGREQLAECLPALLAERVNGVEREVLVLDNGSVDGTADFLRQRHPDVKVIRSPVNLGFAGANDRLAEVAEGEALWLLNNDARPRSGCLEALVEAYRAAPHDVAAIAGRLVDWEGARLDFGRGILLFDGHALAVDQGRPLAAATSPAPGEELLFGCGANLLVRRSSFLDAGGFDERYFAYFEDVDLGWRLWAGGERVIAAPEAVAFHRQSASSSRLGNRRRGALFERNAFWTMTKNLEPGLREKLLPCILMTYLSRIDAMIAEESPELDRVFVDSVPGAAAPELRAERGLARLVRATKGALGGAPAPRADEIRLELRGDRILAQLGGLRGLLGGIDALESDRGRLERRRRRPDLEIFERFPLGIVPTYPGDERWFASAAFAAWLPRELSFRRARLEELISLGERG
jgi:GT2 family glycosyltransferase